MRLISPAAARLATGCDLVARRIGRGLVPADQPKAAAGRVLAAIIATPIALNTLQQSPQYTAGPAAWWLWSAWRAAGAKPGEQLDGDEVDDLLDDDDDDEPEPREANTDEIRAYLNGVVRSLIGDRNGVHLEAIHDALVTRGTIPASHRLADLRATLTAHGIPVRPQLKIGGANRMGVHRADLAGGVEGPSPLAPVPATAAGSAGP